MWTGPYCTRHVCNEATHCSYVFQSEASWAWRRRRNDRTRVPCATRRRTMRTSSSRAACGPAASATASSDAGPSTPSPVRLNSVFTAGGNVTLSVRVYNCVVRGITGLSCRLVWIVSLSGVPVRLETWEGIFQSGKSQGILNRLEKSGKITQNTGKQGISDKYYIILVIFKWTVYYSLKWIKFSV